MLAEEVRPNLPTTLRATATLPGGAVSREAPPSWWADWEEEWRSDK
jgi:hypothetical protein